MLTRLQTIANLNAQILTFVKAIAYIVSFAAGLILVPMILKNL